MSEKKPKNEMAFGKPAQLVSGIVSLIGPDPSAELGDLEPPGILQHVDRIVPCLDDEKAQVRIAAPGRFHLGLLKPAPY